MAAFLFPTRPRAAAGLLLALAATAHAHVSPRTTERADPLDPDAAVPAVVHVSPVARDRRSGEVAPIDWRRANETVNRIGGWRAYAREAQAPASPASAPTVPPAATRAPLPATPATPGTPVPAASTGVHAGHRH